MHSVPRSYLLSFPLPPHLPVFVGCCIYSSNCGRQREQSNLFWLLFVDQFDVPNDGMASPHTLCPLCASSLTSPVSRKLTFGWLLCVIIKQRPPKARDQSLYFLMWWQMTAKSNKPTMAQPNLMESALHGTIGSGGAMRWWHRWSTHGGRGQSRWG